MLKVHVLDTCSPCNSEAYQPVGEAEACQEVVEMRSEIDQLKQVVAKLTLKNRVLKKSLLGKATPWDE